MSGYRTLHRYTGQTEKNNTAIPMWSVGFSPCSQARSKPKPPITDTKPPHRLFSCHADGIIRAYSILDKNLLSSSSDQIMDASALSMKKEGELRAASISSASLESQDLSTYAPKLGSCKLSAVRNHTGESNTSGEEVVASISLDGWVRIWIRPEQPAFLSDSTDNGAKKEGTNVEITNPVIQFQVDKATGTNIALSPPCWGGKSLIVAVGCLDGSVVLCHTDIAINSGTNSADDNQKKKTSKPAGEVIAKLSEKKSTVTSLGFSSDGASLAIGRKDGSVDIFSISSDFQRIHHAIDHWGPVRAVQFTADCALLLTGGDDGKVNAYDIVKRKKMALVSQFVGHLSWILDISACPDGRRFATASSDKSVRIWDLGMRDSVHTFDGHTDQVWGVSFSHDGSRLASCGDDGMIQIYSCDA